MNQTVPELRDLSREIQTLKAQLEAANVEKKSALGAGRTLLIFLALSHFFYLAVISALATSLLVKCS